MPYSVTNLPFHIKKVNKTVEPIKKIIYLFTLSLFLQACEKSTAPPSSRSKANDLLVYDYLDQQDSLQRYRCSRDLSLELLKMLVSHDTIKHDVDREEVIKELKRRIRASRELLLYKRAAGILDYVETRNNVYYYYTKADEPYFTILIFEVFKNSCAIKKVFLKPQDASCLELIEEFNDWQQRDELEERIAACYQLVSIEHKNIYTYAILDNQSSTERPMAPEIKNELEYNPTICEGGDYYRIERYDGGDERSTLSQ